MSQSIDSFCEKRLEEIRSQGLYRQLRTMETPQTPFIRLNGKEVLNFSSNDYLGLAFDPSLKEKAIQAVTQFGVGSGASPLISGAQQPFHDLQDAIAKFKGTESSVVFNTGYATATGTLTALFGPKDIIILDKLSHACLVDGAKMSRSKLRVCRHNDMRDLERILQWASAEMQQRDKGEQGQICVVLESVYSMDGDVAPLETCVELKDRFGAWLFVDEAHATGVLGKHGEGLIGSLGLTDHVEIQMGTLGKAMGCSGGFIAGSKLLTDLIINHARSLIFSTAPSPMVSSSAKKAVEICCSELGDDRRKRLFELLDVFWNRLPMEWRHHLGRGEHPITPILPWQVGDERVAMHLSEDLQAKGFFVPAVRFPTVSRGSARLRITLSATHSVESIQNLAHELVESHQKLMT